MGIKKTSEYFPAYAYVHRVCAPYVCLVSSEPEEGVGSPEIGITTVVSCYVGTEKLCKNRKCS